MGVIVLFPLFILIGLVICFSKVRKPFFFQQRAGYKGKSFTIIKFKTMTEARDTSGVLLPDQQRVTPTGLLLRRSSLDELPQLFNVLKGEMSLIGPRPLIVEYLPLYNSEQQQRHDVKPGITGWAQVHGRNAITWEDKFQKDVWYVQNLSFSIDSKIFVLTIRKLCSSSKTKDLETLIPLPFSGNQPLE